MIKSKIEEQLREITFHSVKDGSNYNVLELKLSELPVDLRTQTVLDKITSIFADITESDGEVIRVPSDDVFVFYPQRFNRDSVFPLLIRVWFLFTKDPDELMDRHIAVFHSLPQDKVALFEIYHQACSREMHKQAQVPIVDIDPPVVKQLKDLTAEGLSKAVTALANADFSNMIRRQSVCAIMEDSSPQELFEEVYVSIADLGDAILPDINLTSTPWLFQYLTETLDKRVLATTARHEDGSFNRDFSLNLNVSTILSDSFEDFNYNIRSSMRSSIVFELSMVDIFSDLPSYLKARDYAQKLGYKICVDAVTPMTLPFTDRERLGADFLKLTYTPELFAKMDASPDYAAMVANVGASRLILCAVDDKDVFEEAKKRGFSVFQGKFMQTFLNVSQTKMRRR